MGGDQAVRVTFEHGVNVTLPAENADALTELLAAERRHFDNAHPGGSGLCAHCHGTGLAVGDQVAPGARRALELRHLLVTAEALVLERELGGWVEPLYVWDVFEATEPARFTPAEVNAAIRAAIARHQLEDVAVVEHSWNPDWHCVVHGECGDGEICCSACANLAPARVSFCTVAPPGAGRVDPNPLASIITHLTHHGNELR
ncbi:hypothetical protein [Kitasatospora sp. HPMI-4]|uniref:hypothetical protein n=1 Tax=Kitasatospora sp. HPMI-4 TaxID=3448443 RepID=UPI003F1AD672